MELLLLACSTYDRKLTLPGKQKRTAYASMIPEDNVGLTDGGDIFGECEAHQIDTDVSEIMAHVTDSNRSSNNVIGQQKRHFIPRDSWNKLSQEERDRLIEKRRQERAKQNGKTVKTVSVRTSSQCS